MSEDSNYVCTLDKASIKKAKDELNEIPEDRLAAVQALRKWIQAQPHIKCEKLDTLLLLRFLRGAKFSQVKAREKFENYLLVRVELPQYALNINAQEPAMKTILESGYIFPLPKKTPDGCTVIMCRMSALQKLFGPLKVTMKELNRMTPLFMHYCDRDEFNQVNGLLFIMDFEGFTLATMTKMLNKDTAKVEKMWTKAIPGRFKGFHYYRGGLFMDAIMSFYKPFMPKKWMDRTKLHDSMETIYKHVPMDCFPVEYLPDDYTGPNAGKTEDLIKSFTNEMLSKECTEAVLYNTGKAFWIDESKRPKDVMTQHFRKLNVD